jgi:hypothetical protein
LSGDAAGRARASLRTPTKIYERSGLQGSHHRTHFKSQPQPPLKKNALTAFLRSAHLPVSLAPVVLASLLFSMAAQFTVQELHSSAQRHFSSFSSLIF